MAGSIGYRVRIRVRDELSAAWWSGTFSGVAVAAEPDGTTLLTGHVPDQAALHGLLAAIRDLGLTLISVETTAGRNPSDRPNDTCEPGGDVAQERGGSR